MDDRIQGFDMNKVLKWTENEVKKYRIFINANPRVENRNVMANLMVLDK